MNESEKQIIRYAIQRIEDNLAYQKDLVVTREDLFNQLYNEDYFIIGTAEAERFLNAFGVFDAIRIVKDYELENFGSINTELDNPELLVNMLAYVKGEEALNKCPTYANNDFDLDLEVSDLVQIQAELILQVG